MKNRKRSPDCASNRRAYRQMSLQTCFGKVNPDLTKTNPLAFENATTPSKNTTSSKQADTTMAQAQSNTSEDPFDLNRFLTMQDKRNAYKNALAEIRDGEKKNHWIWYIMPQWEGLSTSANGKKYAIKSMGEARAYLAHPILSERLIRILYAALAHAGTRTADELLGGSDVDVMKLRSCATLFHGATSKSSELYVFKAIIDEYYNGEYCKNTVEKVPEEMWKGLPVSEKLP